MIFKTQLLHPSEIEKAFVEVMIDLHAIVVFDSVDALPKSWRIRSHDLYGPLPSIEIGNKDDPSAVLERIGREACKLYAISRLRERISEMFPGLTFMPPTLTEQGVVVGVSNERQTVLAEGADFLAAYHVLRSKGGG